MFFVCAFQKKIVFFRFIIRSMSSSISSSIELSSLISSNNEYTVDKIRFRVQHCQDRHLYRYCIDGRSFVFFFFSVLSLSLLFSSSERVCFLVFQSVVVFLQLVNCSFLLFTFFLLDENKDLSRSRTSSTTRFSSLEHGS